MLSAAGDHPWAVGKRAPLVFAAASGDTVENFWFLSAKFPLSNEMESLDWSDRRLTAVRLDGAWTSTSSSMFPVLTEQERSSRTLLGAFHVFFAIRVNFRSGLTGGEPCDITLTVSIDSGKLCL